MQSYKQFISSLTEEERMARADYKVGPSGRKSHKEIVFHAGESEDDQERTVKKEEVEIEEATDTVKKDASGKIISWKHEGDWKKATAKKDARGVVTHMSDVARRKTAELNKEEVVTEGAYEKAEENKKSADAAKKQGDMFAHHLHMADHHDNMAEWHDSKGRHGEAERHAEKSEQHHEKAMGFKEEAPVAPSLVKHRIAVTVSDPNHTAVSKRKEKIQKTVIVTHSDNKEGARAVGEKFYKKKGYRVHDSHHAGMVNEEQLDEISAAAAERYYDANHAEKRKNASDLGLSKKEMTKAHNRVVGSNRALDRMYKREKISGYKEGVEIMAEGKVETKKYSWGTMKTVHHGADFSIPLHPEHHHAIHALKHDQEHKFKDETGRHWAAKREHDKVHFSTTGNGSMKTTVKHSDLKEEVQLDEKFVNGREYASQGVMHPDHAKMDIHKVSNNHVDFYASKTGDKMQGKVVKNDGKEVHIQAHKELGDGKLHKFKVSSKLPKAVNESDNYNEGNQMAEKLTFTEFLAKLNEQLLEYETKGGVYRHKGSYGSSYQGDDDDDDDKPKKPAEPAVKRGRGRPAGSKSGARQKGSTGKSYGGLAIHSLNLPNKNK